MTTPLYPLVNGFRYDYSSIEVKAAERIFGGFVSIDYSQMLEPGEARANRAQVLGRTRGKHSADASFEMLLQEYDDLTSWLVLNNPGRGIYECAFPITVCYAELPASPVLMDKIVGARIKKGSRSHKAGSDALTVKADLSILYVVENGKMPMGVGQMLTTR